MRKPTKWHVRPAQTQISLGIRPVWSESSLSAWSKLGSLATHWAHSEDSEQTGPMPRLIWVFAGRTLILLVLSCRGSYILRLAQCIVCIHYSPCLMVIYHNTSLITGLYSYFWKTGQWISYFTQGAGILKKSDFEAEIRVVNSVSCEKLYDFEIRCPARGWWSHPLHPSPILQCANAFVLFVLQCTVKLLKIRTPKNLL